MKWRRLLTLALVLPGLVFITGADSPASSLPTTLAMTLMQAGGKSPLGNADVIVFYMPFNPTAKLSPPVMATARTSTSGNFKVTLNTSMVPHTGLADVGTGPDSFNAVVFALAPSKQVVFWHMVMQLGHAMSASTSAITDPATGAPALAAEVPNRPGHPPGNAEVIASSYRYVPVLDLNSAPGMQVVFNYTHDQTTTKQTMASAAVSTSTNFGSFSLFSVGGGEVEMSDRSFSRTANVSGLFHKTIWADYKFLEYFWEVCPHERPCTSFHEWDIDRWQGSLVIKNPNQRCARFAGRGRHRHCAHKETIGEVKYKVPHYTSCGGQCTTTLNSFTPSVTRNQVNTKTYSWQLSAAGFVTLGAESAYGTITSATWTMRAGCTGHRRQRVLWGHNATPVDAPILQAACRKP
jgi:hypothetical protein